MHRDESLKAKQRVKRTQLSSAVKAVTRSAVAIGCDERRYLKTNKITLHN